MPTDQFTSETTTLLKTVINGGYCIGCGACSAVENSPFSITLNDQGCFTATFQPDSQRQTSEAKVLAVCPFSDHAINEDQIGKKLYATSATYHDKIGYYITTYAGFVKEKDFRQRGSSGGIAKWILYQLFNEGLIDAVIQVKRNRPTASDPMLYRYSVAHSVSDIRSGSKSVYYPIEMSEVLEYIKHHPGRYAITGVPCFIKALRLLSLQEPIFQERIQFCIGIICGHLKSTRYADMLAWQGGIPPGNLTSIDFRQKLPHTKANEKGVEMIGVNHSGEAITKVGIVQEFFGTNYGLGFFKYQACDYCDDVTAEVADVAIGDAWLPQYINDGNGTSAVVVRHRLIQQLIEKGMTSGQLQLDCLSAEEIARSQDAGLRHRREGLAYRLYLKDLAGEWRPQKRVKAQFSHLSKQLRKIHKLRVLIAEKSHVAFKSAIEADQFSLFKKEMQSLTKEYHKNKTSIFQRISRKILSILPFPWNSTQGK
ncbi:coenzyme F420 hydrogenase/dehydrogenase beta subunit domain protein [Halothece sp. PCC 7418]|uniref:Coenzyme F420 hydrogenase/dehydrogenase, beta subunit C-terminal domain n=1 Tax=Halothece sp. (strain PCC 7418) TaxID=65093 RepID=UPI0002A0710B|nr:Coenzyme F420 hydrogenase/dehydrogenase, beta subunit C-terminal domain [Halothece sp. PCC 7418]AFZ44042.1 coenzyme F420 hydrogenase/dehydrogenase beta subunit domain protein [Halothece sp. PCC 7418]